MRPNPMNQAKCLCPIYRHVRGLARDPVQGERVRGRTVPDAQPLHQDQKTQKLNLSCLPLVLPDLRILPDEIEPLDNHPYASLPSQAACVSDRCPSNHLSLCRFLELPERTWVRFRNRL